TTAPYPWPVSARTRAAPAGVPAPMTQMGASLSTASVAAGGRRTAAAAVRPCPFLERILRLGVEEDDLASRRLEAERHGDESPQTVLDGGLPLGRDEQQHESAATGAGELAADRAGRRRF